MKNIPRFYVLFQAARIKTLPAAICPVVIGGALAQRFDWLFWTVLITTCLIQIATNFANDLFDFKKGADTLDRLGPVRVTSAGLATELQMKNVLVATLIISGILGLIIVLNSHWVILLVGLVSLVLVLAYTTGPFPLSYLGVADFFVIIFFGPVATAGTYFVLSGDLSRASLSVGLAVGLISTAILVVNNTRDMSEDIKVGKRTLQVRFGRKFSNLEYLFLVLLPSFLLNFQSLFIYLFLALVLIFLFIRAKTGGEFNRLLGLTSFALILFTFLFIYG
ncbi:MAG: 1,4-dihydroxy-2-naphthoate octaprenyltransferase [Bdellovibrionota bacterium]